MRVLVGTSGYSYAPWKGRFYPDKLPASKMLAFYAERFPAVEINNTFYRMPRAEVLSRWAAETPAHFRFALKSPRRITHERRLADVDDAMRQLAEASAALGARRGPVLFQLPPFMRKDLPRLEAFLANLGEAFPDARAAFEFRHDSWFADDVYQALRARGAALCIAESEDFSTPLVATAPWGYLRLRRADYEDAAVALWVDRLRAQAWEEAFVFFKHEDEARGPELAGLLAARVEAGL